MATTKVGSGPTTTYTRGEDEEQLTSGYRRRWRHQKVATQNLKGNPGDGPLETPQFSVPSGYRLISIDSELRPEGAGRHIEVFEKLDAFTTTTTTTTTV